MPELVTIPRFMPCLIGSVLRALSPAGLAAESGTDPAPDYCFAEGSLNKVCVGHPSRSEIDFAVDVKARRIKARARLDFRTVTGSDGAWFFLDPQVAMARLDGKAVNPVQRRAPGGEDRIVLLPLASAPAVHRLELEYEVGPLTAWGLSWEPFRWVSDYSDSTDARFSNAFAPASFEADRYPMQWRFSFSQVPTGLDVQTSAAQITRPNPQTFGLNFEASNLAGPYFDFSTVAHSVHDFSLTGRERTIPVRIYFDPALAMAGRDGQAIATEAETLVRETMTRFEQEYGPFAFDRLLVKVWSLETGELPLEREYSMEYGGAVVSRMELIPHELCHQWFGRGASPRDGRAGFGDETVCDWHDYETPTAGLLPLRAPVRLIPDNPWTLRTPPASYAEGAFMAGLSGLFSRQGLNLNDALSDIYRRYRGKSYSHAEFLAGLDAAHPADLRPYFQRYAEGREVGLESLTP